MPVSALQLIMGGVKSKDDFVGDSEINIKTPAYSHHSEIRKIIRKHLGSDTHIPITFISDSQLLVRQMSGIYKIKDATLKTFHAAAIAILDGTSYSFKHVLREYNTQADALANKGIDAKTKIPQELIQALARHTVTI